MKKERRIKVYFTLPNNIKQILDLYCDKNAYNQSKYLEKIIIKSIKDSGDLDEILSQIKNNQISDDNK